MNIDTGVDPDTGARRHTVVGDITFDGLMSALVELYADPGFRPDQSSLWDLREARATEVSAADVRRIADLVRENWGKAGAPKSALVVSSDLDYGMARIYEALLGIGTSSEVQVFRDMGEAIAWLKG